MTSPNVTTFFALVICESYSFKTKVKKGGEFYEAYHICILKTITPLKYYLATRPEASPPINFSTSATVTRLASPLIVCFKQDAATAKSSAF